MRAMGKILGLLLGMAVLGYFAWHTLAARTGEGGAPQTPHERLQNVRDAAKRIEQDEAKRADEVLQKTAGAEKE